MGLPTSAVAIPTAAALIGPRFSRRDLRAHSERYLLGLISRVERKNGWQLAEEVATWIVSSFPGKDDKAATDKNISFFLHFNDPTVPEEQLGSILTAIYVYIAYCMKLDGYQGATPEAMNEYMLECACHSPQALGLLLCVRLWSVTLLARRSERRDDVDLFFTVIKLALPLFCTTHATAYTRICCDLRRY